MESLRRYQNRPIYVQRALYYLFSITQGFSEPRTDVIRVSMETLYCRVVIVNFHISKHCHVVTQLITVSSVYLPAKRCSGEIVCLPSGFPVNGNIIKAETFKTRRQNSINIMRQYQPLRLVFIPYLLIMLDQIVSGGGRQYGSYSSLVLPLVILPYLVLQGVQVILSHWSFYWWSFHTRSFWGGGQVAHGPDPHPGWFMIRSPHRVTLEQVAHGLSPPSVNRRTGTSDNITFRGTTYVVGKDELTLLAVNITSNESSPKRTRRADGCDSLSV